MPPSSHSVRAADNLLLSHPSLTVKSDSDTSPEYDAFKDLLNRIVSVPHSEIQLREAEYKRCADLNPSKPGPKPKRKRASRAPAV